MEILHAALKQFAGLTENDLLLSQGMWTEKNYGKGEFYNEYKNVCKHLGFILEGVFRTYYVNTDTGEEKNIFFFSPHQIIVSYKSFVSQTPCNYHTESLSPAKILYITYDNLQKLYEQSHRWEHFGRLIAEKAFNLAMGRAEDFIFQTPEERYQELIDNHPDIMNDIPLYHIASYLGIQGPSLSRIRKRMVRR